MITVSTLGLVILVFVLAAPEMLLLPFILVAAVFGAIWDILTGRGGGQT